jgi:enoyl-CoA hydratase
MSTLEEIVTVERDGHVARVTIRREDKLNALDADVLRALALAFWNLRDNAPPRCAILTGAGKAFVAGADIAAMATMSPSDALSFSETGHALCRSIEELPFPTVAAVNGFALGGGLELALACDFIYASERAKLGQPEVKLGVIPGFGGTQRLMRRVGIARAREMIYSGNTVDAEQALRIGLVNAVCAPDALLDTVTKLAKQIAEVGPLAVAAAKRTLLHGECASLSEGNALERHAFAALFGSEDQRGGMAGFLRKSVVTFEGR